MTSLIATHNSATGERPAGLFSWLIIPFARTQTKTLRQQYDAGCRMFDLRVKFHKGTLYLAHGLFRTEKTFHEVFYELRRTPEKIYFLVTYEGRLRTEEEKQKLLKILGYYHREESNILWGPVCVKYVDDGIIPDCAIIQPSEVKWPANVQGFLPLDGHSWHTYLPIPWLWKKLYFNTPQFRNDIFTFVDFL